MAKPNTSPCRSPQRLDLAEKALSTSSVRYRRAMLLASAGGNRVPVIAQLVQAGEDTVREVIHRLTRSAWPAWTLIPC
jgi:hypothetical protein